MKTLLVAAIVGVFLFAGSATASWYLMNQQQQLEQDAESNSDAENVPSDPDAQLPPVNRQVEKVEEMPVGFRPDAPITVESVMELSRSIREAEMQLKEREKKVRADEEGIRMMFADLNRERDELTAFAQQVDSKIRSLREATEALKIENQKHESLKSQLAASKKAVDSSVEPEADLAIKSRADVAARYLAGMDDATVAGLLRQSANSGDLIYAGQLLNRLDERKGAKVLSELKDDVLVDQILRAAGMNK